MEQLPEINQEKISEELDLINTARKNGAKDLPSNKDTTLDTTERAVTDKISKLNEAGRTAAEGTVNSLIKELNEINFDSYQRQIKDLPDYISRQVKKGLRSQQDDLIALRKRERRLLGTLNSFEDKHHLEEPAEYPESKIFHWSIVAAMVLVESIANSYFFAKGSDFGLIGGALQALMISVVNIFMALFAGNYLFRNLNHISLARKFFAGAGVLAYGFFVLAFNLATAHYRALLEIDPITALVETIPNLKQGPFDFDNFDAAILLFIGIIFAIAVIKVIKLIVSILPVFLTTPQSLKRIPSSPSKGTRRRS